MNLEIEDCARILESLSLIMWESVERGNLNPEHYADVFELMNCLAASIREKAGCAA